MKQLIPNRSLEKKSCHFLMTDLGLSKNVSPVGQNSSPRITKERKRAGAIKEQRIVTK